MCEMCVHVFGHSNMSSWAVLVCQSEFSNFFVLVFWLFCLFLFFISIAVFAAMFCFCVGCCWPCSFVLHLAFFNSALTLEA